MYPENKHAGFHQLIFLSFLTHNIHLYGPFRSRSHHAGSQLGHSIIDQALPSRQVPSAAGDLSGRWESSHGEK